MGGKYEPVLVAAEQNLHGSDGGGPTDFAIEDIDVRQNELFTQTWDVDLNRARLRALKDRQIVMNYGRKLSVSYPLRYLHMYLHWRPLAQPATWSDCYFAKTD